LLLSANVEKDDLLSHQHDFVLAQHDKIGKAVNVNTRYYLRGGRVLETDNSELVVFGLAVHQLLHHFEIGKRGLVL